MAKIIFKKGNIFNSKCQVLVNTVNTEGIMGKGLALEFKYRFPDMYENYRKQCINKKFNIGMLQLWKKSNPWVLNFPTKRHWKNPSKIEYIKMGLEKFVLTYKVKNIKSIAFPLLGTNLGGLNKDMVKKIMINYLKPLQDIYIEIYEYDPKDFDIVFKKFVEELTTTQLKNFNINSEKVKRILEAYKQKKINKLPDLRKVNGIGESTIKKIYYHITMENKQVKQLFLFQ